jgi:hypothetical protein
MGGRPDEPVILVSCDTHVGPRLLEDLRPHCPSASLDDFDRNLQLVADFESAAVGHPKFDFRYLSAVGGTLDFFREVLTVYEAVSGQRVDIRRVLGWHVRTFLGDAVGRSDAGVALPGDGTPAMWVAEVATRVQVLGAESP